jgi:hypothetical protein
MRASSAIRIRVSDELKSEMQTRARADGISLSHALRTAGRLGLLLGAGRLNQAVATVSAMRRDLHAATADLHQIAADGGVSPDELRAALARVYEAADAAAVFLRRR